MVTVKQNYSKDEHIPLVRQAAYIARLFSVSRLEHNLQGEPNIATPISLHKEEDKQSRRGLEVIRLVGESRLYSTYGCAV